MRSLSGGSTVASTPTAPLKQSPPPSATAMPAMGMSKMSAANAVKRSKWSSPARNDSSAPLAAFSFATDAASACSARRTMFVLTGAIAGNMPRGG